MSDILMFWEYRISMLFMLVYLLIFLSLKYDRVRSGIIAGISFFLTGLLETGILLADFPVICNLCLLFLEIAVVQMTAWFLSSYRDMRAIFTGITAATYVLPGNVLYMGLVIFPAVEESVWLLLVPAAVHAFILIVTTVLLRKNYIKEMESKSRLWNQLWVVPAFFYAITYMLTMWSDDFFQRWQNWVAIFMILILMDIIYIFMMRVVAGQHDEDEIQNGRELLEIYASGLRGQTEELKRMEDEFRTMRHDNKYRYQVIRNCLSEGNLDQIAEILDQTGAEFHAISRKKFCNNIVIDGSVAVYFEKAEAQKVDFQWNLQFPDHLEKLNEFEFATVIMNLLDNAVRSAAMVPDEAKRQVFIKILPVKTQLLLEITNTFVGETQISKVTGLPVSNRGSEHGFGMRSVRAYAEKNNAYFKYSIENGMFCVRLLTEY